MYKSIHKFLLLIYSITLLHSCSEFSKVRKSGTFEERYKMAIKFYDQKEYFKSSELLELCLSNIRGRKEAVSVNYYYAMAQFYQSQYLISSYHFQRVFETYNRSEYAEESEYMYAYSLYLMTPTSSLDQSNTYEAINAYQDFINHYPNTSKVDECNNRIDELYYKLEVKAFENARFLYKVRQYKAAVVSLNNFINEYPSSSFVEEALYAKMRAQYDLADNSLEVVIKEEEIIKLKENRFKDVLNFYLDFLDKYPNSEYSKSCLLYTSPSPRDA